MIFLLIVYGLIAGSFLTAYTYRLPLGMSIKKPSARTCSRADCWWSRCCIPLLSFLLLKGKCRECDKRISFRYPLIEFVSAAGFVGIYYLMSLCGNSPLLSSSLFCSWQTRLGVLGLPFMLLIFLTVLMIFIIDLEKRIIPDELSFFGLVLVFLSLL